MDRKSLAIQLKTNLPDKIVEELLSAHEEAKVALYLGGLRLSGVEGGRFCEAAFRILEHITTGKFTPLGTQLNTEQIIRGLLLTPNGSFSDAVRLHIPRSLRLVYDIRNKRDVAHLADGIDPNIQDATLVASVMDWVLAEFIRLYHNVPANEAAQIVEDIVARAAPVVQDFNGHLKVLNPELRASDLCLVLLYQCGSKGASFSEINGWVAPTMKGNLRRTLDAMVDKKAFAHDDGNTIYITRLGIMEVEKRKLIEPL